MVKFLRIWALLSALCLALFLPAAASGISSLESSNTVAADGSCRVALTLYLELDETQTEYTFPIPADATQVRLGGTPARTRPDGDRLLVILEVGAGSYTATIEYALPQVVTADGQVRLQLLSGFPYPIEQMAFTVTLPGEITEIPQFHSGYYQGNIASMITLTTESNTLQGHIRTALKDHETLSMTLSADRALFSEMDQPQPLLQTWEAAILGTLILATVYYCVTLLPKLTRKTRCVGVPDGITAGEVGTCLTACGTDLTMLVISWAQMGYLTIEIDRADHVTLRKRMEMGNERSRLEMRCFQDLFHRRTIVDGTGQHYAAIYRKMAKKSTLLRQLYSPKSGSPMLFRMLMLLPSLILGVQMGIDLGGGIGSKTVLAILLAMLSGVLSWFIQSGGKCLPLRNKMPLLLCAVCGLLWLVPAIVTEHIVMAAMLAVLQFIGGIAAAYGGKRSELGIRSLAQIRGLRHFLRTAREPELQQMLAKNGDYFYEMAPYALAMGLDRRFARRFGKTMLPEGGYLDVGTSRPMTASQWAAELRYAADILNKAQKRIRPQ